MPWHVVCCGMRGGGGHHRPNAPRPFGLRRVPGVLTPSAPPLQAQPQRPGRPAPRRGAAGEGGAQPAQPVPHGAHLVPATPPHTHTPPPYSSYAVAVMFQPSSAASCLLACTRGQVGGVPKRVQKCYSISVFYATERSLPPVAAGTPGSRHGGAAGACPSPSQPLRGLCRAASG